MGGKVHTSGGKRGNIFPPGEFLVTESVSSWVSGVFSFLGGVLLSPGRRLVSHFQRWEWGVYCQKFSLITS